MYCQNCGKELPTSTVSCPACGAEVFYPVPPSRPIEDVVDDLKRAAKDLAANAVQLSRSLATKADAVAKDPTGSAKKAANKVAAELDEVAKEIDRIFKDL
jgi:predicted  nucleic acid-binding Zn-ribbon protein